MKGRGKGGKKAGARVGGGVCGAEGKAKKGGRRNTRVGNSRRELEG